MASDPQTTVSGWCVRRRDWHFLRGLYRRYDGIVLDQGVLIDYARMVSRGEAEVIRRWPERGTLAVVLYHGEPRTEIQAVFDPTDRPGTFVTALVPGSFVREGNGWRTWREPLLDVPPSSLAEQLSRWKAGARDRGAAGAAAPPP